MTHICVNFSTAYDNSEWVNLIKDTGGLAVRLVLFARDVLVRVRSSTSDHEA